MNNLQRLGSIVDSRMKKTSGASVPVTVEFGKIGANMSLMPDSLDGIQIPKGDYTVNITLASDSYNTTSAGTYSHSHRLPDDFRALQKDDRVVILWCGNEPVVVAVVTSS